MTQDSKTSRILHLRIELERVRSKQRQLQLRHQKAVARREHTYQLEMQKLLERDDVLRGEITVAENAPD